MMDDKKREEIDQKFLDLEEEKNPTVTVTGNDELKDVVCIFEARGAPDSAHVEHGVVDGHFAGCSVLAFNNRFFVHVDQVSLYTEPAPKKKKG